MAFASRRPPSERLFSERRRAETPRARVAKRRTSLWLAGVPRNLVPGPSFTCP